MIRFTRPWFGGGATAAPRFTGLDVPVAVDPAPPAVLRDLRDNLWDKNADAAVRSFRLGAPCRFADEADFRAFFERPEVRTDLIEATENLSDEQTNHLRGKPTLLDGVDFGFEPCSKLETSRELLRRLDTRYGPALPDKGAALVEAFKKHCLTDDASIFRSTRRWAFWMLGETQVSFAILHAASQATTLVVIGCYESFARPVPYGGAPLASFEVRWPAATGAAAAIELEDVPDEMPATLAFARSFSLSAPNSAMLATNCRTPAACGEPGEVARRFETTDILAGILDAPRVREQLRCAALPRPSGTLRFHRIEVESRLASFAAMLETGGAFGERRVEGPGDVARLVAGLATELCGPDPARALVYETFDRWSGWFVGLVLSTVLAVDPATGRIAIFMLCEWD